MKKRNTLVFCLSALALIGSVAWGFVEGGFEPWIVALLAVVGILSQPDILNFRKGKYRNLTSEQKIAARDKWRPQFESYFHDCAINGYYGDAIVHDVDRLDGYPVVDSSEGISSWFRIGLVGTYHKGVLLGLRWTYIEDIGGKWVENLSGKGENLQKVILLGEVPYESIESVNFDGDDYYNKPHLFCHFDYGGEPYERLFFADEFTSGPNNARHYSEVTEYTSQPKRRWKIRKREV
jgi:hypothetical protein